MIYPYRPGDQVSIYDEWLRRWREATVVSASLIAVTADAGGYRYHDLPTSPAWVRPVHIVRAKGRALRRAA